MDKFFASFLLLDQSAMTGIAYLLIILGGVLASYLLRVQIRFRRISYLWFLALSGLCVSISQLLWILTPRAAESGLFSALAFSLLLVFPAFGAALYYASAARSMDIEGRTGKAWLGFVPLANLWLLGRRGSQEVDLGMPPRSSAARFVLDPLKVIAALAVLVMTQAFDKALENDPIYQPSESPALIALLASTQTVEESFAREAKLSSAALPLKVDEITTLTEIEAIGDRLEITYAVSEEISGFLPSFRSTLAATQCADAAFGSDIAKGGTVRLIYRGPSGAVIDMFDISQADCNP